MGDLFIQKSKLNDTTTISNYFIDEYMPKANGEFVKIYLHLLRCAAEPGHNLSLENIADTFSCTEGDVTRALKYWEGLGLLTLAKDNDSNIKGICLEGCRKKNSNSIVLTNNAEPKHTPVPTAKPKYSQKELLEFQQQEDVEQLIFIIESYLGKTLSSSEMNTILFFYNELSFSTELIEYLIEYCVDNNKKNMRYIESVALKWAEDNICTVEQAKANTSIYSKRYYPVLKSLGIYDRGPSTTEKNFINEWTDKLGFKTDMIIEACNKTIDAIHTPNFKYIDTTLKNWHKNGIHTIDDVHKQDKEFKNKTLANKLQKTGFNNFEPRSYDFDELEKQLLASRK